jgi:hypothetical protein
MGFFVELGYNSWKMVPIGEIPVYIVLGYFTVFKILLIDFDLMTGSVLNP